MENNQYLENDEGKKKNSKRSGTAKKVFTVLGVIFSYLSLAVTMLVTLISCNGTAHNIGEYPKVWYFVFIIICLPFSIAGLVFSLLAIDDLENISKTTKMALIISVLAIIWAIFPNLFICGYSNVIADKFN